MSLWPRHEHSTTEIPENSHVSNDPLDAIMYCHIGLMTLAFGVIFPTGLVCGLARNRFHVPVQVLGTAVAIVGYFLGHAHKGRQFESGNIHSRFATPVMLVMIAQVAVGVILKLHINKGVLAKVRVGLVKCHGVVAMVFPILSWVQMVFGAVTLPGFCHEDHLGQCLAHEIMGSSFILYAAFLTIMLYFGEEMLKRQNKSQEFYDSLVITLWGIVNTFTEHRWGQPWSHGDYQHTSMGIIWWCAGMVGLLLSYDWRLKRPQRNHIPALVMIFTGYAMSQHSQRLEVSTQVHFFFGVALIGAGLARIVEVSFVLHDKPQTGKFIRSWQLFTPFLLIESGILFMGATEEQMELLNAVGIMHGSYILIMTSVAFLILFLFLYLLNLYSVLTETDKIPLPQHPNEPGIELEPFLNDSDESTAHSFDAN